MKKILVAMSGGVDSSVAALLLKQGGYSVVGATMKLWYSDEKKQMGRCCSVEDVSDARRVCHHLGIKHYVFNFEKAFRDSVVKNFIDEYFAGRTPNPCIVCNEIIKFDLLLKKAISLGFDYLATGHYARIETGRPNKIDTLTDRNAPDSSVSKLCNSLSSRNTKQIFLLKKGIDEKKDQSYFLYRLDQKKLSKILFPLGELTKNEVREIAARNKLPVALKKESYDVCFIDDYQSFFSKYSKMKSLSEGNFVDKDGKVLGRHRGIAFYTIGQRSGLGISAPEKLYVIKLNAQKNEIVVGPKEEAFSKKFALEDVRWLLGKPKLPLRCYVKIRYLNKEELASVGAMGNKIFVEFMKPQFAITPGQSAVFYDGDTVIGGGVINFVEPLR